jgi:RimJ/RimL family protein N-acetyltransferase
MVNSEPPICAAPVINTARLVLRQYEMRDIDDLRQYRSDPELARYVSLPQPYTRELAERDLREYVGLDARSHAYWAIEHGGRAVGNIDADLETPSRAQLGWAIGRKFWGQGLTTEAAEAVIDWVFGHPSMIRVYATADARNVGSRRVMEKVGMRLEATLREHRIDRFARLTDEVWYGMLRSEWHPART